MRYTAAEKEEITRVVKSSEISISESLRYLGIPKRSFIMRPLHGISKVYRVLIISHIVDI